jgi:hypothetical protein
MDIFQIEARGMYSPPNGASPQMLPIIWIDKSGEEPIIYDNLPELSDEELAELGWTGPIEDVEWDYFTQDKLWIREDKNWRVEEILQENKKDRVDYEQFWNRLVSTNAYAKIKTLSRQSLEVNTIATEFIGLILTLSTLPEKISKVQEALNDIVNNVEFTSNEFIEIENAFIMAGMYSVYTLAGKQYTLEEVKIVRERVNLIE